MTQEKPRACFIRMMSTDRINRAKQQRSFQVRQLRSSSNSFSVIKEQIRQVISGGGHQRLHTHSQNAIPRFALPLSNKHQKRYELASNERNALMGLSLKSFAAEREIADANTFKLNKRKLDQLFQRLCRSQFKRTNQFPEFTVEKCRLNHAQLDAFKQKVSTKYKAQINRCLLCKKPFFAEQTPIEAQKMRSKQKLLECKRIERSQESNLFDTSCRKGVIHLIRQAKFKKTAKVQKEVASPGVSSNVCTCKKKIRHKQTPKRVVAIRETGIFNTPEGYRVQGWCTRKEMDFDFA